MLRDFPDFRRHWVGQAASSLGTTMSVVAFPLLVLFTGGGAVRAGALASCSLIVRTVCRIPAGGLADRYDRRRVMVTADLVRVVSVGTVPVALAADYVYYGHLVAVAVIEGVASAAFYPASMIAVKKVVPEDLLTAALSRNQARFGAVALVGPALGGWLFTVHHALPFAADALTYLVSAVLIARISADLSAEPPTAATANRSAMAGMRWLLRRPLLRAFVLYGGVINLTGAAGEIVVVVGLAERGLRGSGIGAVLASTGAGAVVGALIAPKLVHRFGTATLILTVGGVWSSGMLVIAAVPSPWVIGSLLAGSMLILPASSVLLGQMLLTDPPEHLTGRVNSSAGVVLQSLPALGPLAAGALVDALGVSPSWLVLAVIAVAATATAVVPVLRGVSAPEPAAAEGS